MKNDGPKAPVVAVGAVVIHEGKVLLVQRAHPPAQHFWAIPGGRVNLGESLAAAAEREIFEETRIRIRAGLPVYVFDFIEREPDDRIRFHYVIIDLEAEYLEGAPRPGDDARDARWIAPEELELLPVSEKTRTLLKDHYRFGS